MLVVHDAAGGPVGDEQCVRLGLPTGDDAELRLAVLHDGRPGLRTVRCRTLPLPQALPALLDVPETSGPAFRRPPDTLRVWAAAARLVLRLVAGHRLVPSLTRASDGTVRANWRVRLDDDPDVAAALARLAAATPPAAASVPVDATRLWQPAALLRAFADAVADAAVRFGGSPSRAGRPRERLLPWTARWAEALADPRDATVPLREDADELVAGVSAWLAGGDALAGVTELHLHTPATHDGPWPLTFALRTDDGTLLSAEQVWAGTAGEPETTARQEALLRGLGRCARVFPPLDAALHEPEPTCVALDLPQAWTFICEAEPLLRGSDLIVVLPPDIAEEHVRVRLRVGAAAAQGGDADDAEPPLQGVADYRWEVAVGDETLGDHDLAAIAAAQAPLVRWRDRWLRVDPDELQRLRDLGSGGSVGIADAVALALAGSWDRGDLPGARQEDGRVESVEVVADGPVARLLERLRDAGERAAVAPTPDGFVGELRPYQRRGVAWLQAMGQLGLGAVLADDMGLGKTIQHIAYTLVRDDALPSLVICPTSVVGNWERELHRFAPRLPVTRWHGSDRPDDLDRVTGVVLTTYGTLRRDVERLAAVDWAVVTLDEAQHVKNPQTAGARAVRRLRRQHTVALTGTPLENRLAELWSLLDVTNRGLLGSRARFGRRFVTPVEKRHDRAAAARLRRLVAPFILRREKSDPGVISDLPPKIERTVVCPLTREQADLYAAAVERGLGAARADADAPADRRRPNGAPAPASTMERRGRVLALLTELKQICNHPAQHLHQEDGELLGRSGKLAAAREIIDEAVEAGDRVLVFTQYVRMGRLLVAQLQADLGVPVPFLHGGTGASERDRLVARFQAGEHGYPGDPSEAPPVLVVSLRAGGSGLNLTAASHVVHYDRWWNPAVEDQATDRVHRIGQRRAVEVHKLVTQGTVEERIADLLASKRALTDRIVAAGEAWVTELGDAELRDLVALSDDVSVADLEDDEWHDDRLVETVRS